MVKSKNTMKTQSLFKEYIWLLNTLLRYKKISLAEINEKWVNTELSGGIEIARSTFNRHKEAIENIFGILIECDVKDGYKYYIENEEDLKENSIQNWLFSTLSVNNLLSESVSLKNKILLETIPTNGNYLEDIIKAIKEKRRVEIEYKKYGGDSSKRLTFDPYCLKMHNRRWYLLGHFQRKAKKGEPEIIRDGLPDGYIEYYGTFSLDRIISLKVTSEIFIENENFDAKEYFKECFGIVHGDGTPLQRVVIRAFEFERFNMQDLPWHPSQKIIEEGENYIDYEFHLRPSLDFSHFIIGRGCYVKVLEPQWLADEIYNMLADTAMLYEEE